MRSQVPSASSRVATARSGSPPLASASASAIFNSPSNHRNVLFAQQLDAAAHALEPAAARAACSGRPTLEKHAERAKQVQIELAREAGEFEGVRRDARPVAAH